MRRSLILLGLSLLVAACIVFQVEGSGNVVTETREVADFDHIDLSGVGRVVVDVTGTESLSIEAEDNILPELETEVSNGVLELGTRSTIDPTVEIVYTITAATLDGVSVSGSGEMIITGVDSTEFTVDISGSGNVEVEGTASEQLSIEISGSGEFDGENLTAPEGRVDVSGSGTAVVNVSDNLAVSVSGSGDVEYIGSPTVEIDESGSGTVTQRN